MNHAALFLLADFGDVLRGLIPFVIFIFWIVGQFLSKKGGQARLPKPQPNPALPKPPRPKPPRKARPDELTDEIEAFLRRATQKLAGQSPDDVAADEPVVVARAVKPGEPSLRPPAAEVVQAEIAEPISEVPSGRGVAAHVQRHVGGSAFEERTSHLGEQVGLADEKLEHRLHETFDHRLGQLSGLPSTTIGAADEQRLGQTALSTPISQREDQAVTAADVSPVSPIFRDAEDIRRAIIYNEIFQRPVDRW